VAKIVLTLAGTFHVHQKSSETSEYDTLKVTNVAFNTVLQSQ